MSYICKINFWYLDDVECHQFFLYMFSDKKNSESSPHEHKIQKTTIKEKAWVFVHDTQTPWTSAIFMSKGLSISKPFLFLWLQMETLYQDVHQHPQLSFSAGTYQQTTARAVSVRLGGTWQHGREQLLRSENLDHFLVLPLFTAQLINGSPGLRERDGSENRDSLAWLRVLSMFWILYSASCLPLCLLSIIFLFYPGHILFTAPLPLYTRKV